MSSATATPKRNPHLSIEAATAEATRRWREWATTLAEGRELAVEPREILDAAAYLGFRDPGPQLQADAGIVREVRGLEEQAASLNRRVDEALAAEGGIDAVRRRIAELKNELARLQGLDGVQPARMTAAQFKGKASGLRREHARLFPVATAKRRKVSRRADA